MSQRVAVCYKIIQNSNLSCNTPLPFPQSLSTVHFLHIICHLSNMQEKKCANGQKMPRVFLQRDAARHRMEISAKNEDVLRLLLLELVIYRAFFGRGLAREPPIKSVIVCLSDGIHVITLVK